MIGIIVAVLTYLVLMLSYRYLWVKPNIKVSFPEGTDSICLAAHQEVDLILNIENTGISTLNKIFSLRKRRGVTNLAIAIVFPLTFQIHDACRHGAHQKPFEHPGGCRYIYVPSPFQAPDKRPAMSSLGHDEREQCLVKVTTPSIDGKYPVLFTVTCDQGTLTVRPVFTYIMTITSS